MKHTTDQPKRPRRLRNLAPTDLATVRGGSDGPTESLSFNYAKLRY